MLVLYLILAYIIFLLAFISVNLMMEKSAPETIKKINAWRKTKEV